MDEREKDEGGLMITVVNNQSEQRFEATIEGETAGTLDYFLDGRVLVTTHTVVSHDFEGRGVGSQLAAAALSDAQTNGWLVRPECSFISHYIVKHPEFADLLES